MSHVTYQTAGSTDSTDSISQCDVPIIIQSDYGSDVGLESPELSNHSNDVADKRVAAIQEQLLLCTRKLKQYEDRQIIENHSGQATPLSRKEVHLKIKSYTRRKKKLEEELKKVLEHIRVAEEHEDKAVSDSGVARLFGNKKSFTSALFGGTSSKSKLSSQASHNELPQLDDNSSPSAGQSTHSDDPLSDRPGSLKVSYYDRQTERSHSLKVPSNAVFRKNHSMTLPAGWTPSELSAPAVDLSGHAKSHDGSLEEGGSSGHSGLLTHPHYTSHEEFEELKSRYEELFEMVARMAEEKESQKKERLRLNGDLADLQAKHKRYETGASRVMDELTNMSSRINECSDLIENCQLTGHKFETDLDTVKTTLNSMYSGMQYSVREVSRSLAEATNHTNSRLTSIQTDLLQRQAVVTTGDSAISNNTLHLIIQVVSLGCLILTRLKEVILTRPGIAFLWVCLFCLAVMYLYDLSLSPVTWATEIFYMIGRLRQDRSASPIPDAAADSLSATVSSSASPQPQTPSAAP